MIIFVTQTKGIVAFNDNSSIGASLTEDGKISIVLNNTYILGIYDTENEAIGIMDWIASTIGSHKSDENLSISMPTFKKENIDAEIDRSNTSKQDTQEV
jgi:hypothetical protein